MIDWTTPLLWVLLIAGLLGSAGGYWVGFRNGVRRVRNHPQPDDAVWTKGRRAPTPREKRTVTRNALSEPGAPSRVSRGRIVKRRKKF